MSERTWRANVTQLVAQLRQDIDATQLVATRADAARALHGSSDLYALLVAYSDLAGCSSMAAATAAPAPVVRVLAQPCRRLERAAALFTRAETANDPAGLLAAARQARRSDGELVRAVLAVRRR